MADFSDDSNLDQQRMDKGEKMAEDRLDIKKSGEKKDDQQSQ